MAKRAGKRKEKTGGRAEHRQAEPETLKRQRVFVDAVARLADPLCAAEGMELVHVEYQREPGGLTLRLYLDKPGGVNLDDCVAISRQLEDIWMLHKMRRHTGWRFHHRVLTGRWENLRILSALRAIGLKFVWAQP
jgi:ribosome maturation factor RimP